MNFKENMVAFYTILNKECTRFLRIWPQTFLPSVITTSLYFLIFGHIIGQKLSTINGVSYIEYIMPGLIMMVIITNSYSNTVSSFFSERFQRNIEELIVSSTPNISILIGYVLGGVIRGLMNGFLVFLVSVFFMGYIEPHSITIMITIAVITSIIFSTAGFINGMFARNFDDISWVTSFVLTPLSYLGGIFYSVDDLPGFWKEISLFNPILYCVDIFRYSILSVGVYDITIPFVMIFGFMALLLFVALRLMRYTLYK
jgi:ABC-2 type transport system permease protein